MGFKLRDDDGMFGRHLARTFQYGNIDVAFVLLNGARPTPRLQAIYDRYGKIGPEEIEPGDYRIGLEPVVHAIYPINDERTDLIVYLPANGRMLSLRFTVDTPKLQKALPVLLDLAAHVEVDLPTWPPLPDGYDYDISGEGLVREPETPFADDPLETLNRGTEQ